MRQVPNAMPTSATLQRSRLLAPLAEPAAAGIVLIQAPAGSGKTTFMRQLRQHRMAAGRHLAWTSPATLEDGFEPVVAALRHAFQLDVNSHDTGTRIIGTSLHSWESLPGWQRPFTLFIDDFERLRTQPVLKLIQQLLDSLPEHGEVVIGSRTYPQLELGRLRAHGRVYELTADDLRFSPEEVRHFVRETRGLDLASQDIDTLAARTEGWAAALSVAALALARKSDYTAFVTSFSGSNMALAEFLAQEVLANLNEVQRQFLLDTSILPYLSAPLCNAVTQRADSAEILGKLVQAGLFVTQLDQEPGTLRYHGLFSSFLQATRERERPGSGAGLHERAAAWFLLQGNPLHAIEHLLSGGAILPAMQNIAVHGQGLIERGSIQLLSSWLERLPAKDLRSNLQLRLLHAWALVYRRRCQQALQLLSEIQASEPGLRAEQQCEMEVIRCLALNMSDRIVEAHRCSAALIETLPGTNIFHYTIVANVLALSLIAAGRHDDARQVLQGSLQNSTPDRMPFVRCISDSLEGCIDLSQGRLGIARARLKAATDYLFTAGESRSVGGRSSICILLAVVLYEADEREEARRILTDCIPYAREHGSPGALIFLFLVLARLAYAEGNRALFQYHLADLEHNGREMNLPRAVATAWLERARAATLESNFAAAHQAMRFAMQPDAWPNDDRYCMHANEGDMPDVAAFRLAIAEGRAHTALDELRQAIRSAIATGRHRRALKLRILLCLALAATQATKLAMRELTTVLRFASAEGFYRALIDEGPAMARLLCTWLEHNPDNGQAAGIAPAFIVTLDEKLRHGAGGDPGQAPVKDGALHEPLTWRERDVLARLAQGCSNRAIAEQLFISESTVKTHLSSIYGKLGTNRRLAAVTQARRMGLVPETR